MHYAGYCIMTAAHLQRAEDDPMERYIKARGPGSAYEQTPLRWLAEWLVYFAAQRECTDHPQRSLRQIHWEAEQALDRRRDAWNDRSTREAL